MYIIRLNTTFKILYKYNKKKQFVKIELQSEILYIPNNGRTISN